MAIECPCCGSVEVTSEKVTKELTIPLHPPVPYTATRHSCASCHEEGDFTGENDAAINAVKKKAERESLETLLEELAAVGIKTPYFERALGLAPGTVRRWRDGETPEEAIVLLRIVATMPWILEIADERYAPQAVRSKMAQLLSSCCHDGAEQ